MSNVFRHGNIQAYQAKLSLAPKLTGASRQILWLIVKVQTPFFLPWHGLSPVTRTGSPQHFVTIGPVFAKGATVTDTQTVAFWKPVFTHYTA